MTTETFSSATSGTKYVLSRFVTVRVSGTFVGTIKFKFTDDPASGVESYVQDPPGTDLAITAAYSTDILLAKPMYMRPECTAYTSGSAVVEMFPEDYHTRG